MELSAEDRERIYQEEEARREAQKRLTSEENAKRSNIRKKIVLILVALLVIAFVIVEINAVVDRKLQAWIMVQELVPGSVVRAGLLSKDATWSEGRVKLPSYNEAHISYEWNDTYVITAKFEINSKEQQLHNQFRCRLKYLGSELLESEAPESMAPKAAEHLRYRCHASASGRYTECEYWDLVDLQYTVRPTSRGGEQASRPFSNATREARSVAPTPATPEAQSLSALRIGSSTVHVGDLADKVFPIVNPYKAGTPERRPDPMIPESLVVTHSYDISGTAYRFEFRRREDSGPYRLFAIHRRVND